MTTDEKVFYLDTSIWLDIYEGAEDNGKSAREMVERIVKRGWIIVYSDAVVQELKRVGIMERDIDELLRIAVPWHLARCYVTRSLLARARQISMQRGIPKFDVLHALVARDNEAVLVLRDNHFSRLRDIVVTKLPEEII